MFFIAVQTSYSQHREEVNALNTYVSFVNESTHGILIIHRLLENFNQEVNKYVDLPGYRINNISNSDLPLNIFKDEDHWFYSITPYELYDKIQREKDIMGENIYNRLFPLAREIYINNNRINKARFDISDFIDNSDLTKKAELDSVYRLLEHAVDLIDLSFAHQINLEGELEKAFVQFTGNRDQNNEFLDLYESARDILLSIRVSSESETRSNLKRLMPKLESSIKSIGNIKDQKKRSLVQKITGINSDFIGIVQQLIDSPNVSEEYKLYGAYYYYYNVRMVEKFNRYGNGFVGMLNDLIDADNMLVLHKMEIPHYFKVIYPKRIDKQVETISSKIRNIENIPQKLAKRKVKPVPDEVIIADSYSLEIELFDHKIQDGDIVSINFNGDWVYENISLETKPKTLNLELNRTGKNFVIIHCVSEGRRPPNTAGVHYYYKGKKHTIILESDMNTSVLVEIILDDSLK